MSERDLDQLYRDAGGDDTARPGAAVRASILEQARRMAAASGPAGDASSAASPQAPSAGLSDGDGQRAGRSRWRSWLSPSWWQIATPVCAAALIAVLLLPRMRPSSLTASNELTAQRMQSAAAPATAPPSAAAPAAPPPPVAQTPAASTFNAHAGASAGDTSAAANLAVRALPPAPMRPGVAADAAPAAELQAGAAAESKAAAAPAAMRAAGPAGTAAELQQAAASGDVARVRALLPTASGGINARDAQGRTALLLAVENRQLAVVRTLLARGADPGIGDARGRTPLSVARAMDEPAMAQALLQAGAR